MVVFLIEFYKKVQIAANASLQLGSDKMELTVRNIKCKCTFGSPKSLSCWFTWEAKSCFELC